MQVQQTVPDAKHHGTRGAGQSHGGQVVLGRMRKPPIKGGGDNGGDSCRAKARDGQEDEESAPVLAIRFGFFRDVPHDAVQQPSHHVSPKSIQQGQQAFEERALHGGQATHLHHPQTTRRRRRLVAQRHGRLLQLQEKLNRAENEPKKIVFIINRFMHKQ